MVALYLDMRSKTIAIAANTSSGSTCCCGGPDQKYAPA
jgi:hypothetical protein